MRSVTPHVLALTPPPPNRPHIAAAVDRSIPATLPAFVESLSVPAFRWRLRTRSPDVLHLPNRFRSMPGSAGFLLSRSLRFLLRLHRSPGTPRNPYSRVLKGQHLSMRFRSRPRPDPKVSFQPSCWSGTAFVIRPWRLLPANFPHFHRHSQRKKKNQKERKTTATVIFLPELLSTGLNYKGTAQSAGGGRAGTICHRAWNGGLSGESLIEICSLLDHPRRFAPSPPFEGGEFACPWISAVSA